MGSFSSSSTRMSHETPGDVKTRSRVLSSFTRPRLTRQDRRPSAGDRLVPRPWALPTRDDCRSDADTGCREWCLGAEGCAGGDRGWGVMLPTGRPLPQGVNHMLTFTNCSRDRMAFLQGDRPAGAQARLPHTEPHWGVDGSPHGDFCLGGRGAGGPQAGGTQDSRLTASPGGPGPGF